MQKQDVPTPAERMPQELLARTNFNAGLDELEKLIGKNEYDDTIDALIEKIDQAGVMAEYEPRLLELDRLHANAIVQDAIARGVLQSW